jgi:hypothetical protein
MRLGVPATRHGTVTAQCLVGDNHCEHGGGIVQTGHGVGDHADDNIPHKSHLGTSPPPQRVPSCQHRLWAPGRDLDTVIRFVLLEVGANPGFPFPGENHIDGDFLIWEEARSGSANISVVAGMVSFLIQRQTNHLVAAERMKSPSSAHPRSTRSPFCCRLNGAQHRPQDS